MWKSLKMKAKSHARCANRSYQEGHVVTVNIVTVSYVCHAWKCTKPHLITSCLTIIMISSWSDPDDLTKVWPDHEFAKNWIPESNCTRRMYSWFACFSCNAMIVWHLGSVGLSANISTVSTVVCNSGQARPKMTRKMRTTIEILTPHAQHYDNFLQNFWAYCSRHDRVCGKVHFYGGHFFTWL